MSAQAKVFPCAHPYGTGSGGSEMGTGQPASLCKNRALALQSWFRRSTHWSFWMMDHLLKNRLFLQNRFRRRSLGKAKTTPGQPDDNFAKAYGTVVPAQIPESTAWWKNQSREPGNPKARACTLSDVL